jgi:hypothetical protein
MRKRKRSNRKYLDKMGWEKEEEGGYLGPLAKL